MNAVLALALMMGAAEGQSALADRLTPLVRSHRGTVAIGVKHLGTGVTYFHNPDQVMPTASLIKVAILLEAYLQAEEGRLVLTDPVVLRDADKVPGSGMLTYHFSEGARFSLRDCVRLMAALSDNTATNLVLDRVGIERVNTRMKQLGLLETRLNAKVFRASVSSVDPQRTAKYGLGSTTAREMLQLFERLQTGAGLRPPVKLAIIEHLKRNDDREKFGRLHLPGVEIAHKEGSVTAARTDAGIFYTPSGPILICVLTSNNADRRWVPDNAGNLLCASVARAVYEHFHPSPKEPRR